MGLTAWFRTFNANLTVQNTADISDKHSGITRRLNYEFYNIVSETRNSHYIGSYGRNTAIDGLNELEMVFQLPYGAYKEYDGREGNGQAEMLQDCRKLLRKTYPEAALNREGTAVGIRFPGNLLFNVIPVFSSVDDATYIRPDPRQGGSWQVINPKVECAAFAEMDAKCNNNLIASCRMLKAWNKQFNLNLRELLLDTLAYDFISVWEFKEKSFYYYDHLFRDLFNDISLMNNQTIWNAPGSGREIHCSDNFQDIALNSHNLVLQAIELEEADSGSAARRKWREIFGDKFPV